MIEPRQALIYEYKKVEQVKSRISFHGPNISNSLPISPKIHELEETFRYSHQLSKQISKKV